MELIEMRGDFNSAFYQLMVSFHSKDRIIFSNFQLEYNCSLLTSNTNECSLFRKKAIQMNRYNYFSDLDIQFQYLSERQSSLWDVISGNSKDEYIGTIGFIKINRVTKCAKLVYIFNAVHLNCVKVSRESIWCHHNCNVFREHSLQFSAQLLIHC